MLASYLNQTAEYMPVTGSNKREEPVYGSPATITCRKQMKTQQITTADGRIIKAEWVYYLAQPVDIGDSLDGRVVQLMTTWTTLGGVVLGYKVVV